MSADKPLKPHEKFNHCLKEIFKTFKELPSKTFKTKLHIQEMQAKMARGMQTEEKYAITVLGPFVWRARQEIKDNNAKFFLERRYDLEVAELSRQHKFAYDAAVNTIGFMKDAYLNATDAQQAQILQLLNDLLVSYSQYALTSK